MDLSDMHAATVTLEDLARRSLEGDREALDQLVHGLQGDIHGLALRMLWNREDAEDATQEVLVRIVTRLSQFGFQSRLKTWAYRVAFNYILDVKKSAIERLNLGFERFADDLERGLLPASANDRVHSVLIEEVKVGCSLAMLQCLDRPHRAAYLLGEVFELSGPEAAEVLEISPVLFRRGCSRRGRWSSRSCNRTAGWSPMPPRAGATNACPRSP